MSPLVNWEFYFDPSQATIQIESEEKILLVCGEQIQNTFIQNLSTRNVQSNIEYEWNWTQWQWANAEWCLCLPASPIHIYTWLFAHSNIMTVTHHEWVRRVLVKHNSIFEFQLKRVLTDALAEAFEMDSHTFRQMAYENWLESVSI